MKPTIRGLTQVVGSTTLFAVRIKNPVEKYRVNRIKRAALVLGVPANLSVRKGFAKIAIATLSIAQLVWPLGIAHAGTFSSARVALADPRPSQTTTYTVTVSSVTNTAIRCIKADFSNAAGSLSAIGNSFSAASATVTAGSSTLVNSSGTGWTATPSTNQVTYTHATGITPSTLTAATFIIANVNNASVADTSYWLRFSTYNNVDCATSPVDNTTMGFIYTNGSTLSLTVDQTLTFTVNAVNSGQPCNSAGNTTATSTATTIPFGTVSPAANGLVCQDLTASTNATNGYTIFARYTAAPTNGLSQTIADHASPNSAPTAFPAAGTLEAYGYSTNDATLGTGTADRFTNGAPKFAAMTTSNNEVAYEAAGVNSTTYRLAHQVGVTTLTKPGTYTTTVIYTCTPVY